MATRKTTKKRGRKKGGNASDFIRKQPPSMSPKDIMAAGKKAGIKFSPNLVYAVRSSAKRVKGKRRGRRPGRPSAASSSEAQFRKLVVDLGLGRAKNLIAEVEQGVKQLIDGV